MPPAKKTVARKTVARSKTASITPVASVVSAPKRQRASRQGNEPALELRILEVAINEFAEHGLAGARIERISAAAGTVDRMLYYYYGNKEKLYQAALEQCYTQMIAAQRNFIIPEDAVAAMRKLVEHCWDHYANHPEHVRLLMNENLLNGRFIQQSEQVEVTSSPLVDTCASILQMGQEEGTFRADAKPEQVLMTIMSLGFFYLSNQHTCAAWIGVNLMTRARRSAWRTHISEVVLSYLLAEAKDKA